MRLPSKYLQTITESLSEHAVTIDEALQSVENILIESAWEQKSTMYLEISESYRARIIQVLSDSQQNQLPPQVAVDNLRKILVEMGITEEKEKPEETPDAIQ